MYLRDFSVEWDMLQIIVFMVKKKRKLLALFLIILQ